MLRSTVAIKIEQKVTQHILFFLYRQIFTASRNVAFSVREQQKK